MTDDEKVAQRYRELGAEEPPRALDEAILAAARREAAARPAALQVRSSRQRWYAPLATAAILVLAVAVALQTQVEQPDTVTSTPQSAKPAQPAAQAPAPQKIQTPAPPAAPVVPRAATDVARAAPDQARPKAAAPATRAEPPAFAPDPPPPPQTAPGPARAPSAASGALAGAAAERDERIARADLSRERSQAPAAAEAMAKRSAAPARALAETPERELEHIAEMRAQGRQDEADRALAEFRKRYPDYRIPEEIRLRVERR